VTARLRYGWWLCCSGRRSAADSNAAL